MACVPNRTDPVITVTSVANSGAGSLRAAIEKANTHGSAVELRFAIGSGPATIRLDSPLPPLAFGGLVDGWTQPGIDGAPLIEINGAAAAVCPGLEIVHGGLTVRGVVVTGWQSDGIYVHDCDDVALLGLHVGVALDGETAAGNGGSGIHLVRAERCLIGGPSGDGVVVSGNHGHGIWLEERSHRCRIVGSRIGTDREGRAALPNDRSGVKVEESYGAALGGVGPGSGNVISGNGLYGIEVGGPQSRDAVVVGNLIGTDVDGLAAIPNLRSGIVVYNTPGVRIGGATADEANVISGGARSGVNLDGSVTVLDGYDYTGKGHANGNTVQGNLIGVDRTGERPLGNQLFGVLVNHAQDNTVVDNVISANGEHGVLVLGPDDDSDPHLVPSGNRVLGNRIGVTPSGAACGNGLHGVLVYNGRHNEIGGETAAEANIISGNQGRGVMFLGAGARTNVLGPANDLGSNAEGAFHQPPEDPGP